MSRVKAAVNIVPLWCLIYGAVAAETSAPPTWIPAPPESIARWQDLRFGLFIHWGPVSLTGLEIGWSRGRPTPIEEYDALYRSFNPTNFDADAWVNTAQEAGMKYVVLTTKHHDGFCLWPSDLTDYDIAATPFARDVVGELAAACRRHGVKFGTYYSVCDWWHPDFPKGGPGGRTEKTNAVLSRYVQYYRGQLRELVTRYGPLVTMWFDMPQIIGPADGLPTVAMLRELQPDILINNRAFVGAPGDYTTPEQRIGAFDMVRPWETCMTLGRQWAWKPNDELKSRDECVRILVRTISGNGNLLLNVGPMPDGRIEPRQVDRLRELGAWVHRHARAIYETRGGPYRPGVWGGSTRRGRSVFLHVFEWPESGLVLPPLPYKVVQARLLTADGPVAVQATETGLVVRVESRLRDSAATVVELELDGDTMAIEPIHVGTGAQSLSRGARVRASNVFGRRAEFQPERAVDGDFETRWATDAGTKSAWLEIDLGRAMEFSRVVVHEWDGDPGRIRQLEVQVREGADWRTIAETRDVSQPIAVPRTRAQEVRLWIREAREGPTLTEVEILP